MRIKKFLPYLAILLLIVPVLSLAANNDNSAVNNTIKRGGWQVTDITKIIDDVAKWLYIIGLALAVIIIIAGGISYMTAGGDEEKTGKAKKTIITGLIGAAIIVLAGIILDTLVAFLSK